MTKIVQVGNIACGSDQLFLISGPCVIETEDVMLRTAEKLKEVSERMKVPVIYKSSFTKDNRSSVDFYQGPGLDEGLKVLARIKKDFGFPILTDIHYPSQAKPALKWWMCYRSRPTW
jgi:2-dehydro-3-deoxyphosphooctonate aldolase (KDO 8-P synthase)